MNRQIKNWPACGSSSGSFEGKSKASVNGCNKKEWTPDAPKVDRAERNKQIYGRYLDGLSFAEISREVKLSKERVKLICKRVEIQLEKGRAAAARGKSAISWNQPVPVEAANKVTRHPFSGSKMNTAA